MKGLTAEEYAMLRAIEDEGRCTGYGDIEPYTPREGEIIAVLEEQGRVEWTDCLSCETAATHCWLTFSGREAMKLWAILVERELVEAA